MSPAGVQGLTVELLCGVCGLPQHELFKYGETWVRACPWVPEGWSVTTPPVLHPRDAWITQDG